jgi:hypothetical protein
VARMAEVGTGMVATRAGGGNRVMPNQSRPDDALLWNAV